MKAQSAKFLQLIKGRKQFIVPIYQRPYSWHINHCAQLIKDILRIGADTAINMGHFIGSIVYFEDRGPITAIRKLQLIDGQQRLTTVLILIAAMADFLKKHDNIQVGITSTKLQNYYLYNFEEEDDNKQKLLLTKKDRELFIQVINGVSGLDVPDQILNNYKYFGQIVTAENIEILYNGLLKLIIVDVVLERGEDDPQAIFESLNSTGLALSQADLIRNYILMSQSVELQQELYEKYWYPAEQNFGLDYNLKFDHFIRDYISVKTGSIPNEKEVYYKFKILCENNRDINGINNIKVICQELNLYSRFYANIALYKEKDKDLLSIFTRIIQLKVDVAYPFLLAIYADYDSGMITTTEFIAVLHLVESYVFRRAICEIPTNSLNKTFVNLHKQIDMENYVESESVINFV